jgi:hypothetical protein
MNFLQRLQRRCVQSRILKLLVRLLGRRVPKIVLRQPGDFVDTQVLPARRTFLRKSIKPHSASSSELLGELLEGRPAELTPAIVRSPKSARVARPYVDDERPRSQGLHAVRGGLEVEAHSTNVIVESNV